MNKALFSIFLLAVISNANQASAQSDQSSVGPAPVQTGVIKNDEIFPSAPNLASRAFCYNGAGPFLLNNRGARVTCPPACNVFLVQL